MYKRQLKYHDIELHFDRKAPHGLYLIYSDDEIELSMTAEHEETLQPITNTEPVDNEFFLRDGEMCIRDRHYLNRDIAEKTARECYPEIRDFTYDILWNDLPKEVQEQLMDEEESI